MDPHTAGEPWPLLADDRQTQGVTEADQGSVDQCGAKALQWFGRAGERHHCRFPPQGEEPGSFETKETKTRVYTPGALSGGSRKITDT